MASVSNRAAHIRAARSSLSQKAALSYSRVSRPIALCCYGTYSCPGPNQATPAGAPAWAGMEARLPVSSETSLAPMHVAWVFSLPAIRSQQPPGNWTTTYIKSWGRPLQSPAPVCAMKPCLVTDSGHDRRIASPSGGCAQSGASTSASWATPTSQNQKPECMATFSSTIITSARIRAWVARRRRKCTMPAQPFLSPADVHLFWSIRGPKNGANLVLTDPPWAVHKVTPCHGSRSGA